MVMEEREIEIDVDRERGHSGTPVAPRDLDAVNLRRGDAWAGGDDLADLGCRDVLALPAERAADPLDEIEEALLVPAHEIAGTEPGVAGREDVAKHFLGAFLLAGVALETAGEVVAAADPAEGFADLVPRRARAATVRIADRLATRLVELDD